MEELIRLNKFISDSGSYTRKDADRFIEEGRVTVNGRTAATGTKINPETDKIKIDGEVLNFNEFAVAQKKALSAGWRAEKKAAKEAKIAEASANPKSRTLRAGRKQAPVKTNKLDEINKRHDNKKRPSTKEASMRMEDAIKNPYTMERVKGQKKDSVNPKSSSLRKSKSNSIASKNKTGRKH